MYFVICRVWFVVCSVKYLVLNKSCLSQAHLPLNPALSAGVIFLPAQSDMRQQCIPGCGHASVIDFIQGVSRTSSLLPPSLLSSVFSMLSYGKHSATELFCLTADAY